MRVPSILVLAALTLLPASAHGQAWDAPSFLRPGAASGLSMALTDSDPGSGLGFVALWRGAPAPTGLGFRAGLVEAPDDDLAGLLGIDVSGSLSGPMGPGSPEAMWWTGAGVRLGDDLSLSAPLGVVLGWTAREEGVSFMPYAGAHVVLDIRSGEGDDLELDGVVDLGVDVGLSGGWVVRVAAAVGGRDALAIGARIPR